MLKGHRSKLMSVSIDEAVHTEKLSKRYGNLIADNRVDLTIPQGVAFGYLGPNGAEKQL